MSLKDLPNIGDEVEKQLKQVGIETEDELKEIGSAEAWLKIKDIDPSACYSRLCALEGAIQGIRWHNLSIPDKKKLKEFYEEHCRREKTF